MVASYCLTGKPEQTAVIYKQVAVKMHVDCPSTGSIPGLVALHYFLLTLSLLFLSYIVMEK